MFTANHERSATLFKTRKEAEAHAEEHGVEGWIHQIKVSVWGHATKGNHKGSGRYTKQVRWVIQTSLDEIRPKFYLSDADAAKRGLTA